ncbi:hypothetical protein H5410_022253 [Solanum commersonii]|uniref:Uncharacterized protein n=1 Tax=Solanum commersonii TaxID=4109 RepID=A0A9J5ZHH9_SOLCO|nr:hypothetical protein H5410_022253 [Solanum commersonii]
METFNGSLCGGYNTIHRSYGKIHSQLRPPLFSTKTCHYEIMGSIFQRQRGNTHYNPFVDQAPKPASNCWNSVGLSKIGSSLGKPLYADECATQTSGISFA